MSEFFETEVCNCILAVGTLITLGFLEGTQVHKKAHLPKTKDIQVQFVTSPHLQALYIVSLKKSHKSFHLPSYFAIYRSQDAAPKHPLPHPLLGDDTCFMPTRHDRFSLRLHQSPSISKPHVGRQPHRRRTECVIHGPIDGRNPLADQRGSTWLRMA